MLGMGDGGRERGAEHLETRGPAAPFFQCMSLSVYGWYWSWLDMAAGCKEREKKNLIKLESQASIYLGNAKPDGNSAHSMKHGRDQAEFWEVKFMCNAAPAMPYLKAPTFNNLFSFRVLRADW